MFAHIRLSHSGRVAWMSPFLEHGGGPVLTRGRSNRIMHNVSLGFCKLSHVSDGEAKRLRVTVLGSESCADAEEGDEEVRLGRIDKTSASR